MKSELCKCNNCGSILIDENPQTDAKQYQLSGNENRLIWIEDKDGPFWACPECKTDKYLMDIDGAIIYTTEDQTRQYTYQDVIDIAKCRPDLAQLLLDMADWQGIETLVDEWLVEGEIIEFMDQYFLTKGDEYLSGNEAKNFWMCMNTASSIGGYENNDYPRIGGFFPNGNQFIAFDNTSGNANVDVFASEKEAIKYATGKPAITISGETY